VAVYERRANQLGDEKRELLMKCTAAVAEREQAVQTAKLLAKELSDAKERTTALELEKERALRKFHARQATPQAKTPAQGKRAASSRASSSPPFSIAPFVTPVSTRAFVQGP
jgi:trehalose-6-phosphatase